MKTILIRLIISLSLLFFVNVISEKLTDYFYVRGFKLIGIKAPINDMNLFYIFFVFGCLAILYLNCEIKFKK